MEADKAVTDLASSLEKNYKWDPELAKNLAEEARYLPKFQTLNSFYLATAYQFRRQLESLKKKPKTPEQMEELITQILSSASSVKTKSADVLAKEIYTVASYYLLIQGAGENRVSEDEYVGGMESQEDIESEEEDFTLED